MTGLNRGIFPNNTERLLSGTPGKAMGGNEGWKAIWKSPIDNYDDLDGYTEDTWDSNGEREMSPFAKEFGIDWYDPDAREFDLEEDAKSFKYLFNGVSNEDAYVDELLKDLVNYDRAIFRSFMILHDYKYDGQAKSDKAVFVGNYRYR